MTTPETHTLAEQLNSATRSGKLADAYRVLQAIPANLLTDVALRAGYRVIYTRTRRDLMAHIVSQVSQACRAQTDGFGLRANREAR